MLSKFLQRITKVVDKRVFYTVDIHKDYLFYYYDRVVYNYDNDLIYKDYVNSNDFGVRFILMEDDGMMRYEIYDDKKWFLTRIRYAG